MSKLRILIEAGQKRVFAVALDWPGLARSGRTEQAAIESLVGSLARFAVVAESVGEALDLDTAAAAAIPDVVERVEGNATTDFGAPGIVAAADGEPLTREDAERQAAYVRAAWQLFERVAGAAPESLQKGPRGGGRDRSKIVEHVDGADRGYATSMGIRAGETRPIADVRAEMLGLLARPSDGSPLAGKRWPPRYAARRVAWHAIDHAWEIEDRSGGA
jgi:hypothetical protein